MTYLGDHRRITEIIEEELSRGVFAVDVAEIARRMDMDPRTVKNHLDILEMDGFGVFVNSKRTVFISKKAAQRIIIKSGEE